jgi:hypothetical protein
MLLPVSVVLSNGINYLLAFPVILLFMAIYRMEFTPWLLYLPIIVVVQATFLIGLVLILSSVYVNFRDTIVLVEVGLTAWFFMTPIFYRVEDVVPDLVSWMYWLNPMASIVAELHTVLYYGGVPDPFHGARLRHRVGPGRDRLAPLRAVSRHLGSICNDGRYDASARRLCRRVPRCLAPLRAAPRARASFQDWFVGLICPRGTRRSSGRCVVTFGVRRGDSWDR